MRLKRLICATFLSCLAIVGCGHKSKMEQYKMKINPELKGQWSGGNKCAATFAIESNSFILLKLDNAKGTIFANVKLSYIKDGVMIKLTASDKKVPFAANYIEGVMMIDKYCTGILNKVNN